MPAARDSWLWLMETSGVANKLILWIAIERHSRRVLARLAVNLDFDARVPIPFSIFPSSYRSDDVKTTTQTHVEGEIRLPHGGREGHGQSQSQSHYSEQRYEEQTLPARTEHGHYEDEIHIHREESRRHSPDHREDIHIREERRPTSTTTKHTHLDIEVPHRRNYNSQHHDHTTSVHIQPAGPQRRRYEGTQIDIAEREYRSRFQPSYREESRVGTTVDAPRFQASSYQDEVRVSGSTVDAPRFQPSAYQENVRVSGSTVDPPRFQPSSYQEEVRVSGSTVDAPRFTAHKPQSHVRFTEETVDAPRFQKAQRSQVEFSQETVDRPRISSRKMGYYDEDGHYHSIRHGLHKAADRVLGRHHNHSHHTHTHSHHGSASQVGREEVDITIGGSRAGSAPITASMAEPAYTPNTVTIPCHHIRLGDLLILQGRPCQVIRITTSSATGQHRYLGVDLFTKQLHEESSFISHPSPSVVVQTMLGPVFKQYRVLDLQDGVVVAMTETGDVKQAIPVIDQSNLWSRLTEAFESGRGSVRVQVISDHGKELVVDMKTIHGSRL
ncbi:hypothetical protein B2J93_1081 [Marssonina coronariae]|uniref:Uncharacterized protein n=1 Tax=Diplocarpon coronariae TaxID=2795749 RepID=A0A218Z097_9HELO|nr:hypothetical protein B2J93_1081 [Marssonina coronariae]